MFDNCPLFATILANALSKIIIMYANLHEFISIVFVTADFNWKHWPFYSHFIISCISISQKYFVSCNGICFVTHNRYSNLLHLEVLLLRSLDASFSCWSCLPYIVRPTFQLDDIMTWSHFEFYYVGPSFSYFDVTYLNHITY
jgi:hypothetical protein